MSDPLNDWRPEELTTEGEYLVSASASVIPFKIVVSVGMYQLTSYRPPNSIDGQMLVSAPDAVQVSDSGLLTNCSDSMLSLSSRDQTTTASRSDSSNPTAKVEMLPYHRPFPELVCGLGAHGLQGGRWLKRRAYDVDSRWGRMCGLIWGREWSYCFENYIYEWMILLYWGTEDRFET